MVQLFIDGGGFMWPILIVFIFGFTFVGERIYHLMKGLGADYNFATDISNTLKNSGKDAAISKCNEAIGPVANLCYAAVEKSDKGLESAEKSLDQASGIEMASLEKNMTWISLSIAIAPMFGFLGTVWGMIEAFNDIKMANDISPAVVAGGISVALLTTAFGLVVALILQFLQNLVMYIIDNQIVTMQKSTALILDSISDKNNS
jgi:biopolymer transport protein ExbB